MIKIQIPRYERLRSTNPFLYFPHNIKIAYAQTGEGLPILKTGNWLTHLETDSENFIWRHLIEAFSEDFKLIRYDGRGCGLSERDVTDFLCRRRCAILKVSPPI